MKTFEHALYIDYNKHMINNFTLKNIHDMQEKYTYFTPLLMRVGLDFNPSVKIRFGEWKVLRLKQAWINFTK